MDIALSSYFFYASIYFFFESTNQVFSDITRHKIEYGYQLSPNLHRIPFEFNEYEKVSKLDISQVLNYKRKFDNIYNWKSINIPISVHPNL